MAKVKTVVAVSPATYDKATKTYTIKDVKPGSYEFDSVSIRLYEKADENKIGIITIDWSSLTIRENDWEFGKYRSAVVEKGQLYANIKKGFKRKWMEPGLELTFVEVTDEAEKKVSDSSDDSDLPF